MKTNSLAIQNVLVRIKSSKSSVRIVEKVTHSIAKITLTIKKMTPDELKTKVGKLKAETPTTHAINKYLTSIGAADSGRRWYRTQKEHWLGWLSSYKGPGYYNRKEWKNRSAEFIYNHIGNPEMLIWLGDAAGVTGSLVKDAKHAVMKSRRNYAAQCAAIRKHIPWDLVESFLLQVGK